MIIIMKMNLNLLDIQIKIVARENAKVKVYYIQRNNENSIAIQSISALAYKNANVDVVEIEAGSKKTYFNFRASLIGDESNVDTSVSLPRK